MSFSGTTWHFSYVQTRIFFGRVFASSLPYSRTPRAPASARRSPTLSEHPLPRLRNSARRARSWRARSGGKALSWNTFFSTRLQPRSYRVSRHHALARVACTIITPLRGKLPRAARCDRRGARSFRFVAGSRTRASHPRLLQIDGRRKSRLV